MLHARKHGKRVFVRYDEVHRIKLHFVDGFMRCWSPSRKDMVRVVLSKQQREILRQIVDKHALKRRKNSVVNHPNLKANEGRPRSFGWCLPPRYFKASVDHTVSLTSSFASLGTRSGRFCRKAFAAVTISGSLS